MANAIGKVLQLGDLICFKVLHYIGLTVYIYFNFLLCYDRFITYRNTLHAAGCDTVC